MKRIIQLLLFTILILTSIKLVGQEEMEGYRNGLQIISENYESSLIKEMEWDSTKWDEIEWTDIDTSIYKYDSEKRLIKIENFLCEDSIWVASYNVLYEYLLDGKGYIKTIQNLLADEYREEKQKIEHTLNEENIILEEIESEWRNPVWIKQSKTAYRYDNFGNKLNEDYYRFEDNEWKLVREKVFVFDVLDDEISRFIKYFNLDGTLESEYGYGKEKDTIDNQLITDFWSWDFGTFRYNKREINYLNDVNLVDSLHILIYRGESPYLHRKKEYDYNLADQLIQESSFDQINGSWEPRARIIYEYDESENLIFRGGFYWSSEVNDWLYSILLQEEWTYSENNILLKEVRYGVSDMIYDGFYKVFRILTYYAEPIVVSMEEVVKDSPVNFFPNPTNQFLTINLEEVAYPLDIKLINIQGQVLQQQKIETNLSTINVKSLPSGPYFVQIRDMDGQLTSSKIIKQ